jgi:hypothetical protein
MLILDDLLLIVTTELTPAPLTRAVIIEPPGDPTLGVIELTNAGNYIPVVVRISV